MNAQTLIRRRQALAPPPNVTKLSREELIAIVRSSPADPARHTPLERIAWREIAIRGSEERTHRQIRT